MLPPQRGRILLLQDFFFKNWDGALSDPNLFMVKRQYDDDNIVSHIIKNQNDYYLEYQLHEHHELPSPLKTIGERAKVRKQNIYTIYIYIPYTISSPTKGTGLFLNLAIQTKVSDRSCLKILTFKQMLQKLLIALVKGKSGNTLGNLLNESR